MSTSAPPAVEAVRGALAPRLEQARDYVAPRLEHLQEYVAPRLEQAQEYVAPRWEEAQEKLASRMEDVADRGGPAVAEARLRGGTAVAALRGDVRPERRWVGALGLLLLGLGCGALLGSVLQRRSAPTQVGVAETGADVPAATAVPEPTPDGQHGG